MRIVAFVLLVTFSSALAEKSAKVNYEGYRVIRTEQLDITAVKALRALQSLEIFDFWRDPVIGRSADIMCSPHKRHFLEEILREKGIAFSVMIEDIEKLDEENRLKSSLARSLASSVAYDWNDYYGHAEINAFIDGLASANSKWVKTVSIGKTPQRRDMRVIQITKAGPSAPNVWIEAGVHAREWIASAVATYLINELVNNNTNSDIIDKLNIHVLPLANPDGYEYSMSKDRLWRKNRRQTKQHKKQNCFGTDLNRNFKFHWGESGVSLSDTCSDVYCGPKAFSEPETRNIERYTKSLSPIPVLGHSIHSYGQLWLWPYGYGYNAFPSNKAELKKLAEDASAALTAVHGTIFDPENSAELYPAAGASDDWYRGVLGVRYAFTTELRDTGYHGFLLPPEQIIPSGEEFLAGMRVVFEKLIADAKVGK